MKKSLIVIAAAIGLVVIASVAVLTTSGDDSRRQGALGGDEPVTLSWGGDWNAEKAYTPGSVVTHDGGSYVAEGEKLSTPKPDCIDCGWTLMGLESLSQESAPAETEAAPAVPLVRGYEVVYEDATVPGGAGNIGLMVSCPKGKMPLSGGAVSPGGQLKVIGGGLYRLEHDAAGVRTGTWIVQLEASGTAQKSVRLYATCALVD
jgi:hypothetical protein